MVSDGGGMNGRFRDRFGWGTAIAAGTPNASSVCPRGHDRSGLAISGPAISGRGSRSSSDRSMVDRVGTRGRSLPVICLGVGLVAGVGIGWWIKRR